METGRKPRLWRLRAEWIPAYAGMTMRYAPRPQYPLPAAFAASSPLLGRGGMLPCERGV